MKLAVLSESPADEAALRILVEALLGRAAEPVDLYQFETRLGCQGRLNVLSAVYKHLYYQTDADGLVFVVDSDTSPVHETAHDQPGNRDKKCRICKSVDILEKARSVIRPISSRAPLRCALGLAVPTIEAWLLCGADHRVTERAWLEGLKQNKLPYSRNKLKEQVYKTDRPNLELEKTRMVEEANRLCGILSDLERCFPEGFGLLAKTVRSW